MTALISDEEILQLGSEALLLLLEGRFVGGLHGLKHGSRHLDLHLLVDFVHGQSLAFYLDHALRLVAGLVGPAAQGHGVATVAHGRPWDGQGGRPGGVQGRGEGR